MRPLRSIVWPQEDVEEAKVWQKSVFLNPKWNVYSLEKSQVSKYTTLKLLKWNRVRKAKYSSWNFDITTCIKKDFFQIWKVFFCKRTLIKVCFFRTWNWSKKKSSANCQILEVICCEIQGQFVISTSKTDITNWSQNWCLHYTRIVENASLWSGRPPWCLNAFSLFNAAPGIKIKREYDAPQQKGKVLFLIAMEKFK